VPEQPFHAVNCAALPVALAEAELFGYRKGAFTGAERHHGGHLRAAGQGILFLDEVAELPLPIQAKLLRALDTGELSPIGETGRAHLQARVLAACQVPLAELVRTGVLREDLAARLDGLVVTLPELSARRGDIPVLFHGFLHKHSAGTAPPVSTKLYAELCLHEWPANVRELEQLARRLLAVHGLEPVLRRSHLPAELRAPGPRSEAPKSTDRVDAVERLTRALQGANGNVKKAAATAGISRQSAYRLINSSRLNGAVATAREGEPGGEDGPGD
jgi:transcriptional regulator with PAS, ATPase and Fis domain